MTNTTNSKSAEENLLKQAVELALAGKRVTFVSAEYTHEETCLRFMAVGAKVSVDEARAMLNGTLTERHTLRDAHLWLEDRIKEAGGELRFGAQIGALDWPDLGKLAKDTDYMIVHMPAPLAGEYKPRGMNSVIQHIDTLGLFPAGDHAIRRGVSILDRHLPELTLTTKGKYVATLEFLSSHWTDGGYLEATAGADGGVYLKGIANPVHVTFSEGGRDFVTWLLKQPGYRMHVGAVVRTDDPVFSDDPQEGDDTAFKLAP